jgi:hypothetical protein
MLPRFFGAIFLNSLRLRRGEKYIYVHSLSKTTLVTVKKQLADSEIVIS